MVRELNVEKDREGILYVIEDLLDQYKYLSKLSQIIKFRLGESLIGKSDIGVAEDRIKEVNKYNTEMVLLYNLAIKYANNIGYKLDYDFDKTEVYDIYDSMYDENKVVSYQFWKLCDKNGN